MALFRKKEDTSEKSALEEKERKEISVQQKPLKTSDGNQGADNAIESTLKQPRITEKATFASERGAYVFEVAIEATKKDIARAIETIYKVKPVKINVTRIPSKKIQSRTRGLFGRKPQGKKAYVYLKEGDTIEIV